MQRFYRLSALSYYNHDVAKDFELVVNKQVGEFSSFHPQMDTTNPRHTAIENVEFNATYNQVGIKDIYKLGEEDFIHTVKDTDNILPHPVPIDALNVPFIMIYVDAITMGPEVEIKDLSREEVVRIQLAYISDGSSSTLNIQDTLEHVSEMIIPLDMGWESVAIQSVSFPNRTKDIYVRGIYFSK